jgi:GDPmannose 4,6-dehydratase
MKTTLVTGLTGQDGLYAAEYLLAKNYRVIGVVRNVSGALNKLPVSLVGRVELVPWDMMDQSEIVRLLSHYRPSEVYNFAAYSSGKGMFDDVVAIGEVNGLAVARILEAIRDVDINIRFCQASSSEMFGETIESPQSENALFHPRSPYGAAKLYAHSMVRIYRQHYGVYACSAILFNHESPRRGLDFVTKKIVNGVAKIKLGIATEIYLGDLDARRDWGFAGDYVRAMWMMLQQSHSDDYVVATGETHSVRELCELAFTCVDLDYRDYVREDVASFRPKESVQLVGCVEKIRHQLGWYPEVRFRELVSMMVDAELDALSNTNNVKTIGNDRVQAN